MTTTYKILGQSYIGLTSYEVPGGGGYYYGGGGGGEMNESLLPVTVYTVPNSTQAIISSIFIVNHDSVARTYDLAIVPAGESLAVKHHIRWDKSVDAHDFDLISSKLALSAGSKIVVLPSTVDKVGVTICGLELT